MQVNVAKLKGKAVERGLTGEDISKKIGVDQSTYYRKLKENGGSFTLTQVFGIADALSLTKEEAIQIFFDE